MKKKLGVTIGAITGAAVLGLGIYHSSASQVTPELSSDDIKQLVLDQYPGEITELELDKEGNKAVYEIEILGDGKEYELKLDGNNGEVMNLKEKTVLNAKGTSKDDRVDDNADDRTDDKADDNADDQTAKNDDKKSTDDGKQKTDKRAVIKAEEAEEIALKEMSGKITSLELDEDDGRLIYEIEVHSDKKEAEMEIDAYTGEIIVMSIDQDDNDNDDDDDNDDDNE